MTVEMDELYERCSSYRRARGLPWFTKAWDLNVLVFRSSKVGSYDDLGVVCCLDDVGRRIAHRLSVTGDAWEGEWLHPSHPDGCIYILDQHVPRGFVVGTHKGRPALRQASPFRYVRWPKEMGTVPSVHDLELRGASGYSFSDQCGTHWHNNWDGMSPEKPRRDESEGCTVSLYWHEHAALLALVEQQRRFRGSDVVSPTFGKLSDLPLLP